MSNPFKNQYTADGIGTDFVYSFAVPINRAVLVYETLAANQADEDADLVSDTLYTIIPDNPSSATSTGIVRFNSAPADQSIITITPDQATLVTYVFSNTAPFNTDNLNGSFEQEAQTNGYNLQNFLENSIRYNVNENDGNLAYDNKVSPLADNGFWRRVGAEIVSQDFDEFVGEVAAIVVAQTENYTNASADNTNLSHAVASNDQGVQYSGNPKRVDPMTGQIINDPLIQGFSAKSGALWAQAWAEDLNEINDDYGNTGRSARFYSDQASVAASSAGGVLDQLRIFDTVSATTQVDLINYGLDPDEPWLSVLENGLSVYVDGVRLQEPTAYSPPSTPPTTELTYTVTVKDPPTLGDPSFITFSSPVAANTEIFIIRSEPQGGTTNAKNVSYDPPVGSSISLNGYLDRQGVWAEDAAGIQQANDYIVGLGKRDIIQLAPRLIIPATSSITLDMSYVSLDGHGTQLDFSGMASGSSFVLTGSEIPPYFQNSREIRNIHLLGAGQGSPTVGWEFNNPSSVSGEGPSHIKMTRVNTESFGTGEKYIDRAYLVSAYGCDVLQCGIGIHAAVAVDGGENLQRFGGAIFNGGLAVKMENSNGEFFLFGVSVDFCDKIIEITSGHVMMHGCHVEASDYSVTPVTISGNGAGVNVDGGWWLLDSPAPHTLDHWVDAAENTSFRLTNVRMNNTQTATNEFSTGDGAVTIEKLQSFHQTGNCEVLHSSRSKLVDGGFEQPKIVDDIFIYLDTQPITDRHVGTNVNLSVTTDQARTGSQSLVYVKQFGAGSLSAFILAMIPVTSFQQLGGRIYWRKPADASTGSFSFNYIFAKIEQSSNQVPVVAFVESVGSKTIPIDNSDTGWVEEKFSSVEWAAPEWATHFLVEVNGFAWNGGNNGIFFDDLNINVVG